MYKLYNGLHYCIHKFHWKQLEVAQLCLGSQAAPNKARHKHPRLFNVYIALLEINQHSC